MGVRRMTAAVVVEGGDQLGECPVWDPGRSELLWTDIQGRRLHRLTWTGRPSSWRSTIDCAASPSPSTAIWWRRSATRVARLDRDTGAVREVHPVETELAATRCNDGRPDRHGGFVFGTMDEQNDPRQALGSFYHWDAGTGPALIHHGVAIANGLCFSPDGLTIYYADTPLDTIWQAR